VDAIGLRSSGAHRALRVIRLLRNRAEDIMVFRAYHPDEDFPGLTQAGVAKLFTPGTTTTDVLNFVQNEVEPRRAAARA
jgi:methylmalonyl-CoA mutase C-terminal domain/subunit